MWWAQMWHHTLLTGWDLKTVCILENGKLLWSTFHLQLHFSIIRDLSILRGIFPHKRYQLLTLLISLWTASWVRTWVHGKKDRKKQEPSFFWENKDESAVLCELNPAFAMNHGSSCFILTFSSLWSLISSLSQLLSCKNEISYLKDKRWKLQSCVSHSRSRQVLERGAPRLTALGSKHLSVQQERTREPLLQGRKKPGKAFWRDGVAERQQIHSWMPWVPPRDVPGLREPVPGHTHRRTPQTLQGWNGRKELH